MNEWHWIRPWALLLIIPLCLLIFLHWKKGKSEGGWAQICDPHLLQHLMTHPAQGSINASLLWLALSLLLCIIGLAGPSWEKLAVPSFQQVRPHVLLLDMSQEMADADISPSRIERAKFLIEDILKYKDKGQFALLAYTAEPFVVSPLTEDNNTIIALMDALDINIMPVGGHDLAPALKEAQALLTQAGYNYGQVLVFSANPPKTPAIDEAGVLAKQGLQISMVPMVAEKQSDAWQALADAGQGTVLNYARSDQAIRTWLASGQTHAQLSESARKDIPLWKDQGRWFILLGAMFLMVVFRRGWLQRLSV